MARYLRSVPRFSEPLWSNHLNIAYVLQVRESVRAVAHRIGVASMKDPPSIRQLQARIGGYSRWAKEDPRKGTKPAREGFMRRFCEQTSDDLPEAERHRRAEAALRAHMTRLALRSAQARRKRAQ
jgi:hypothetical protein